MRKGWILARGKPAARALEANKGFMPRDKKVLSCNFSAAMRSGPLFFRLPAKKTYKLTLVGDEKR